MHASHQYLLIIRYPCPFTMYDIMYIRSDSALGNFKGLFSHSMSKARIFGSHSSSNSFCQDTEHVLLLPPSGVTEYHAPTRKSISMAARIVYGTSYSLRSTMQLRGSLSSPTPPLDSVDVLCFWGAVSSASLPSLYKSAIDSIGPSPLPSK